MHLNAQTIVYQVPMLLTEFNRPYEHAAITISITTTITTSITTYIIITYVIFDGIVDLDVDVAITS